MMNQKSGLILAGVVILIGMLVIGYLAINHQNPEPTITMANCTLFSGFGEILTIDKTQNNATICARLNSSFTIRLNENRRTGCQWYPTVSSGLQISDDKLIWYDEKGNISVIPGICGVREWNVTTVNTGIQTINAFEQHVGFTNKQPGEFDLTIFVI